MPGNDNRFEPNASSALDELDLIEQARDVTDAATEEAKAGTDSSVIEEPYSILSTLQNLFSGVGFLGIVARLGVESHASVAQGYDAAYRNTHNEIKREIEELKPRVDVYGKIKIAQLQEKLKEYHTLKAQEEAEQMRNKSWVLGLNVFGYIFLGGSIVSQTYSAYDSASVGDDDENVAQQPSGYIYAVAVAAGLLLIKAADKLDTKQSEAQSEYTRRFDAVNKGIAELVEEVRAEVNRNTGAVDTTPSNLPDLNAGKESHWDSVRQGIGRQGPKLAQTVKEVVRAQKKQPVAEGNTSWVSREEEREEAKAQDAAQVGSGI